MTDGSSLNVFAEKRISKTTCDLQKYDGARGRFQASNVRLAAVLGALRNVSSFKTDSIGEREDAPIEIFRTLD
jgi:hypothetical protein